MVITEIDPTSPLYGHIDPGYKVVSVNGQSVIDAIDFRYKTSEEQVKLVLLDKSNKERIYTFDFYEAIYLGLEFEPEKVKICNCNCIFCFVSQQPKGMRRSLYIKDEDYRLSFTHGNFITLSNITKEDLQRIIDQHLSPIYISVHITNDDLRRKMLRNNKLLPIIPILKQLTENGITIHTQVVLCPGINDGKYLEKTINDLAVLSPGIGSLAIVPVGITKYRDKLTKLRNYSSDESKEVIDYIETCQKEFFKNIGTRFLWAADEFYVLAGREFPRQVDYEEFSQIENGIGLVRQFISMFNRRRSYLSKIKSKKRVLFLTGHSAIGFMQKHIVDYIKNKNNLHLVITAVTNHFWGETVTVSGLLTGQDLLDSVRSNEKNYDTFVLPPDCLNNDALFLDNVSLEDFCNQTKKEVIVGCYDVAQTIKEAFV